jgi:hypothetical protein
MSRCAVRPKPGYSIQPMRAFGQPSISTVPRTRVNFLYAVAVPPSRHDALYDRPFKCRTCGSRDVTLFDIESHAELVPSDEEMENAPAVYDTLKTSPDMVNVTASRERLQLAGAAGALILGTDVAETIQVRNSWKGCSPINWARSI